MAQSVGVGLVSSSATYFNRNQTTFGLSSCHILLSKKHASSQDKVGGSSAKTMADAGELFQSESFDWAALRSHNLIYHCQTPETMICGKLLAHCKRKVTALREHIGVRLCCFKIGVTTNPPLRFSAYMEKKFTCMWVIAISKSIDTIHMLEAAVIAEFCQHVGCRNKPETGGEGSLNRLNPSPPPFYLYMVAARADQPRRVG